MQRKLETTSRKVGILKSFMARNNELTESSYGSLSDSNSENEKVLTSGKANDFKDHEKLVFN